MLEETVHAINTMIIGNADDDGVACFSARLDLGQVSREIFEKMSGGFFFSEKKV